MARRSRRRARHELNAWPGYVDALSTLLMVITFVLMVFVVGQQFLASSLYRRTHALDTLKNEIAALQHALSNSTAQKLQLKAQVAADVASEATLRADLEASQREAARQDNLAAGSLASIGALQAQIAQLNTQLGAVSQTLVGAQAELFAQNAQVSDLEHKLDAALADDFNTLKQYRSEFFGKLRAALKNQNGISIVGDRFVFQSSILFPTGSASLTPEGVNEINVLAKTLRAITPRIPKTLPWILRVDGHADKLPIHSSYMSNWDLSSARAITVVQALISAGIDPRHLAATGFSDYHPIDKRDTPEAYAKNRRIEFRLTDR